MSTEITSLNATNATTTTAKMQGPEAPKNATVVAAFAQPDQVAKNATTATTTAAKMQGQEAPPTNITGPVVVATQADPVANATTATTTTAKMQGPEDPTNATVAAFAQPDPVANATTATAFKAKDATYRKARYINLNEDMKQKRLEQMRECDRKRRLAKRKLKLETQLKQTQDLN